MRACLLACLPPMLVCAPAIPPPPPNHTHTHSSPPHTTATTTAAQTFKRKDAPEALRAHLARTRAARLAVDCLRPKEGFERLEGVFTSLLG